MKSIVFTILGLGLLASVVNLIGVSNDGKKELPVNPLSQEELEAPKTVSYEPLDLAATDPSDGHYTISVFKSADLKSLDAEKNLLETESIPFRILEVVDSIANNWYVLSVGEYKGFDEAQKSQANLESRLGITGEIIWLPSKK